MSPVAPDTLIAALREATRAEHARIEDVLRLTEPMPLPRYTAVVTGFAEFLRIWESRVAEALPARLAAWFEGRGRSAMASADVEWLRSSANITAPAFDASAARALPLGNLAEVIGSMYVIEGSSLGGQLITPRLRATLGLEPGQGASYFNGFAADTGRMWRDFRTTAEQEIGSSPQAVSQACQSARDTFTALITLFSPLVARDAA